MTDHDIKHLTTQHRTWMGLNSDLWRLALVIGIAQISMSTWTWRFSIFIESAFIEQGLADVGLAMGLTFSSGTLATLVGYPTSGIVSDMIGRKRTMMLSFIPMTTGLYLLHTIPLWPWIPIAYALVTLGWSFILVISRAVPADVLITSGASDRATKFTMILLPAFLADGLSPLVGSILIISGLDPRMLILFGSIAAVIALFMTGVTVRESLSRDVQRHARSNAPLSLRGFGRPFWLLAAGMLPFYFVWNMALPYLGNISTTGGWQVSDAEYGMTWSAFSLTSVIVMYIASRMTDRNTRAALVVAVVINSLIVVLFGIGSGFLMMLVLNIVWSFPVMWWVGSERALVVEGVSRERQGRAMGTYSLLMSSTGLVAPIIGQHIWTITGSLRTLYVIAGMAGVLTAFGVTAALRARHRTATISSQMALE